MARNILIVEDDPSMQGLYRSMFGRYTKGEFTLHLLTTGEAVLPFLWEHSVDLLLLDWDLPQRSGLQVLRSINSNPAQWRFPILIVSAKLEEQLLDEACGEGASGYFVKPFAVDELLARVRELLRLWDSSSE